MLGITLHWTFLFQRSNRDEARMRLRNGIGFDYSNASRCDETAAN